MAAIDEIKLDVKRIVDDVAKVAQVLRDQSAKLDLGIANSDIPGLKSLLEGAAGQLEALIPPTAPATGSTTEPTPAP